MKFIDLAREVLPQRERDGVRGIDREWSRFRCHLETASFAERDVREIKTRDIREWLREVSSLAS